jgi:transposase InsO family protein
MAGDGVAVDVALVALVGRIVAGETFNVSVEAARLGTSRKRIYHYVRRYRAEGIEGFIAQSRRPEGSPNATSAFVEDAIVVARKRLAELGLDIGATSIAYRLEDNPDLLTDADGVIAAVPSRATINRILARRGQLTPVPARRPQRTLRRFVRPAINDLWQLDGYETTLSLAHGIPTRTGKARIKTTTAVVIDVLDDHSRRLLASHAATGENAEEVWVAFQAAAAVAGGLPRQLLTDNATALNGSRQGFTAGLEAAVTALGVEAISTSIGRPQANGKVERVHATQQRWLAARETPTHLSALQELLDEGREHYNFHRRHQALDGRTPAQVWNTAYDEQRVSAPTSAHCAVLHVTNPTVSPRGAISVDGLEISVGRKHIGAAVTVFRTGRHIAVFINGQYDHERDLDPSKRYQGQSRGS